MAIKRIPKKALNCGYTFLGTALLDYHFTDKEMAIKDWVYKSLGEYLKLRENVRTCYAKEVVAVLPTSDETDFKIGYSEFTCTAEDILKDKEEIEVGVVYNNYPDKTLIRIDASQLCTYLKENYEKTGIKITVSQTAVLDMLTGMEDTETHSYSWWFWMALLKCIPQYHTRITDAGTVEKDEPKITKKEAWERLNSEIVYNGTYVIKGHVFPEECSLSRLMTGLFISGETNKENVRLLHNTLQLIAKPAL